MKSPISTLKFRKVLKNKRVRIVSHEAISYPYPQDEPETFDVHAVDGPELMDLAVYANTLDGMMSQALAEARKFYGEHAQLRIADMSHMVNVPDDAEAPGAVYGHVFVLCLDLMAEKRYPVRLEELSA